MSRAFMVGAASQAGDADSSRAPGLTSGMQGSVHENVHRGALLLVSQWQCISFLYFTQGTNIYALVSIFIARYKWILPKCKRILPIGLNHLHLGANELYLGAHTTHPEMIGTS